MIRSLATVLLLTALLAVTPIPAEAGAPPFCSSSPCLVDNEAELLQALDELSGLSAVARIELTGNILLSADSDPTYTGVAELIIDGADHFINGGLHSRILHSDTNAPLAFEDITIRFGSSDTGRGPIEAGGEINITRSTIENNATTGVGSVFGGAIFGDSFVTVTDSTVTGNTATTSGGNATGGAIRGANTVRIDGSTVSGNTAESEFGTATAGAAQSNAKVEIVESTLDDNKALGNTVASGGAAEASVVTVTDSTVRQSRAISSTSLARGGGVWTDGTLTVTRSFFGHNEADGATGAEGGGAYNGGDGTVTITDSMFWENYARGNDGSGNGGGIKSQGVTTFRIDGSTIRDNSAHSDSADTNGAGVFTSGGTLTVSSSSISRNYASAPSGFGAGINADGADLNLYNATVAYNIGATAPGARATGAVKARFATVAANVTSTGSAQLATDSTLLAAATVVADAQGSGASDCSITGATTALTANYATDGTCGFTGFLNVPAGPDPMLGEVRDNGGAQIGPVGATPTPMSRISAFPLQGSPLIDVMTPGQCNSSKGAILGLDDDQRDVPRPFGDGCDIGAIESIFPVHGFTDVTPFYDPTVRWITSTVNQPNILDGFDDNTFRQAQNITRGQVVRMYYRAAGEPDVTGLPAHGFTDVTPFFANAVRWAKSEGIFDGFDDGTFRQANPINRGNFVRSLSNFAGAGNLPQSPPHGFTDVTPFYENAVRWAAANGLADGFNDDTFRQTRQINRGNASRITYNLAQSPDAWGLSPNAISESMLFRGNLD